MGDGWQRSDVVMSIPVPASHQPFATRLIVGQDISSIIEPSNVISTRVVRNNPPSPALTSDTPPVVAIDNELSTSSPSRSQTANTAAEPVPQDSVSPTPRSQTRILTWFPFRVHHNTFVR